MTFGQPLWFWAFAAFPVLIALFFGNETRRTKLVQKLVAARLAPRLAGSVSVAKRRLRFALLSLGMTCVIVALAQPQLGYTWEETKRRGRDVIVAIDTSRSMLATDVAPNRLTRAKLAVQDLISQLEGDRIGLVAFAGSSFLQAPLTADYGAVRNALEEIDTEIIPRGGTNIAGAIRTARDAFGKGESDHRGLIILTDGEELEDDSTKAAEELKGEVRIFTVGVASEEGSLVPVPGGSGGTEFVKDAKGQFVKSRLDESRLREIAESTGGFYLPFRTGRAEMEQILRDGLGKMNEQEHEAKLSRQPIERYQWPLSAGLVFLASSMLLGERRRARVAALMVVFACFVPSVGSAKNSGVEAYERQDYKGALERFGEQLKRQPRSPELHFNTGSAAYKAGDLDLALNSFSQAITSSDPQLRAKAEYNLGNTLFQRGVNQKAKPAKVQEWKNSLQHYEQALKIEPQNADAKYNAELVRKMLEELEKEPPKSEEQQKKQDQKKQDQEKKEEDKQSGGSKQEKEQGKGKEQEEQSSGDSGKEEGGEQGEQKKKEAGAKGDEEQKENANAGGEKEDDQQKPEEDGKEGEQSEPKDQGEPKPEGELKSKPQFGEGDEEREASEGEQEAADAAAAAKGEMTPTEAKNMLDSMKANDVRVRLLNPRERKSRASAIKDW